MNLTMNTKKVLTVTPLVAGIFGMLFSSLPSYAGDVLTYYGQKGRYTVSTTGYYTGCLKTNECLQLGPEKAINNANSCPQWQNGQYTYMVCDTHVLVMKNRKVIFKDSIYKKVWN